MCGVSVLSRREDGVRGTSIICDMRLAGWSPFLMEMKHTCIMCISHKYPRAPSNCKKKGVFCMKQRYCGIHKNAAVLLDS